MVRFLINITNDMKKDLKNIADERGQTLNSLIRQILWDWLDSRKDEKK